MSLFYNFCSSKRKFWNF